MIPPVSEPTSLFSRNFCSGDMVYLYRGTIDGESGIVLGHEAYRDGEIRTPAQQEAETFRAVQAHTEMALRMLKDGQDLDLRGYIGTDIDAYLIAEHLGDMSLFEDYANTLYSSDADLLDFDFLNKDTKVANWLNGIINDQIAEKQELINITQEKAKNGEAFTAEEQSALKGVYDLVILGGRMMGYPEASKLLDIYTNPEKASKYREGNPYKLNPRLYQESAIVQYAMEEMKKMIAEDYSSGTINNPSFTSKALPSTPDRDSHTEGRILDDGKLIAEQNNQRLKNTDHRFPLQADVTVMKNGSLQILWSVTQRYDFSSYPTHNVTQLPFSRQRNQVLRIPDGLSDYLTKIGMAQTFHYRAQWKEQVWYPKN